MDEVDDDYFHSASHAEQMMLKMDAYFDKQQVLLISVSCSCCFHCRLLCMLLLTLLFVLLLTVLI